MIYSYRRVSTDEQHLGPQAQLDAIQRWGASDMDFCDIGVSGSLKLCNRPEGGKMLASLSAGDVVVIAKLDRLFRSTADAAATMDDWCKRGIKLVSIAEGFDFTSPMGKFMSSVMAAFAELERDMIRARTKAALGALTRQGRKLGKAPYGYTRSGGQYLDHPSEQATLKLMLECRAAGMMPLAIAKKLDGMGIPARSGGLWDDAVISKILRANRA